MGLKRLVDKGRGKAMDPGKDDGTAPLLKIFFPDLFPRRRGTQCGETACCGGLRPCAMLRSKSNGFPPTGGGRGKQRRCLIGEGEESALGGFMGVVWFSSSVLKLWLFNLEKALITRTQGKEDLQPNRKKRERRERLRPPPGPKRRGGNKAIFFPVPEDKNKKALRK